MKNPFRREVEKDSVKLRLEIRSLRQKERDAAGRAPARDPLVVVARALREAPDLEAFVDAMLAVTIEVTGALRGTLVVATATGKDSPGAEDLELVAPRNTKERVDPDRFGWSRSIALVAVRDGKVVATGKATEDERFGARQSVKAFKLESVLALPLPPSAARPACLYFESPPVGFEPLDAELLVALADLAAVGVARFDRKAETERHAALEAIGAAAAVVAHDLRSPIATAEFGLGILRATSPEEERALVRVREAFARARELAAVLVGIATGRDRTVDLVPARIAELVERRLAHHEHELEVRGITLARRLDAEALALVDLGAFERILDNLIENAQRAMPEGGPLEIGCAVVEGAVEVSVSDAGPGISPDKAARAFHLSEATGSGGLGLFIVGELTRACGGTVRIESEQGRGARFVLSFRRP